MSTRLRALASAAAVVTVGWSGLGLGLDTPAAAAAAPASDATFAWRLSEHAFTSSSLAATAGPPPAPPSHDVVAPAVRDAVEGFTFTAATATYDPDTGAAEAAFTGSFALGNVVQGGYRIQFADPVLTIGDDGAGQIVADVAYCESAAVCSGVGFTTTPDVVVATFRDATASVFDDTVTWVVTPDFPRQDDVAFPERRQFPPTLLAALPASLQSHFRESGSSADAAKAPAPFVFSLTSVAEPTPVPSVTVAPATGLDPAGDTVTVTGLGFTKSPGDPSTAGLGLYVRLCAEAEGEVGTAAGRPGADRCASAPQHWVGPTVPPSTAPLSRDGTFSVTLEATAAFSASGTPVDCHAVQCGIAVRRDHNGGATDFSYDSFTPLTFEPGDPVDPEDPEEPEEPETPIAGEGTLDWGLKASFRNYIVNGPAAGSITPTAPATVNPDGTFRFELGDDLDYTASDDLTAPFEGTVRFTGHEGQLDLVVTDPRVDIAGASGTLVVDATSRSLESGTTETFDDVTFAELDLSAVQPTAVGDDVTFAAVPATLTADGAEAFAGFYPAGEALDPVSFTITVDDPGELPAPPSAPTVGCVPTSVVAGATVEVCADGYLPGEQVQAFLHSTPRFLAVLTADAGGRVAGAVVIPVDVDPGAHRIELRGATTGRSLFSASFSVTATRRAAPTALAQTGPPAFPALPILAVGLVLGGAVMTGTTRRLARRPRT